MTWRSWAGWTVRGCGWPRCRCERGRPSWVPTSCCSSWWRPPPRGTPARPSWPLSRSLSCLSTPAGSISKYVKYIYYTLILSIRLLVAGLHSADKQIYIHCGWGLHSSALIPNSCWRSCSCCSIESMESDWQWQWTVMIIVNKLICLPSDPPATHRQTYEQCLTMFWMKNIVFRESCYSWQWAKFLCPSLIELSKTPWTIWILYSSF